MMEPFRTIVATSEDLGCGGEVLDQPVRWDCTDEGEETFEDEDPSPAVVSADPGHVPDTEGKNAT